MTALPLAVYADVVDTDPEPGIRALIDAGWQVEVIGSADPEVVAVRGAEAEALLIGYLPVTAELLDRMPRLRVVATQSVGVDMVDLDACAERGIAVSNVPASATEEVATHALAMALALVRELPAFDRATKSGEWDAAAVPGLARPSSLRVGVLGLGRIGRRFAGLAGGVFGSVCGYDPMGIEVDGADSLSLEEVLRTSDVVSLHLPLTPETHHLLDAERLAMLPAGARLINVSRGALVDADALVAALEARRIGAAALDVFAVEPPEVTDPLLNHPRVLATPHAAFLSPESARDYVLHQAENVIAFGRDGAVLSPVG